MIFSVRYFEEGSSCRGRRKPPWRLQVEWRLERGARESHSVSEIGRKRPCSRLMRTSVMQIAPRLDERPHTFRHHAWSRFLSNLALTKSCVFRVHITQGHGRNRRFSWQKRTQVEDFAPLGVASLGSKRFPTHGGRPKAAAGTSTMPAAPYGSSSCAICTAFRAAPLRIWSATTHMAKP